MATYFHGSNSEIQSSAEGLQTLYLMNPNYVPYSDAAQHPTQNMLLVNPNTTNNTTTIPSHALNLANFSHAPPSPSPNNHHRHHEQQPLIGVTFPSSNILGSNTTDDPTRPAFLGQPEIPAFHGLTATAATTAAVPRVHYNLWGSIMDQSVSTAAVAAVHTPSNSAGCVAAVTNVSRQIGFHRPNNQLSLSLSSQHTPYRSFSGEVQAISPASRGGDDMRVVNNGVSSMHSVVLGSKYLKAAQEVLDEVVNVGKGISKEEESMEGAKREKMKGNIESTSRVGDGSSGGGESSGGKQGAELSTAQRQELQMKKSKLVNMLDEVEQRYRQYHHQMQIVISSFEQVAGIGAAKSYTALALKTISKQFRCLKDSISSQIRTTTKTLGEDDCLGVKVEGSRLRYVDHHLRQQRALQQLGMIQHNAWRPQRGLPERAVSILRAWLFEHFLHPYPKDSDKVMLAKQTGLTRSQVSNWFINARVRLWKPMVEEMYLEEVKQEDNGSQDNNTNRSKESGKELWTEASAAQDSSAMRLDQINVFQSKAESFNNQTTSPTEISNSNSMSTSPMGGEGGGGSLQSQSGFHLPGMQSPKRPRSASELQNSPGSILSVDMEMKSHGEANNRDSNTKFGIENHGGGFGAFSMEDIGRFNVTEQLAPRFHGNGVSLTLGLPHSETLPLSGTQHGFLSQNMHLGMGNNENEFCGAINTPPSSHSGTSYESIDIQNRKRFAAAQLLRDFVA
ncbi:BEL1-like homeodomain protein 1 [Abrus precatorius]|uniref:BEL1-like homeodomain protein 1 n=1 Tax=Abrus precatorius TaxID=3816 RepID=A0A8B8KZX5_ABRPR|nr:BEL1-like homeodomain protein 1 [Abrus precatorius]XP_027347930.1 BEL1-like homeodomain protein 1 [Abrus precatorius]XP_027347931.1 BEL1-like homeodomain protein 1 [Abrus precatorius]